MQMSEKSLIYAVDDEQAIRELYRYALESADFDVTCFADGDALLRAVATRVPNLFLLDIMLDGMDGYEILEALRRAPDTCAVPVIMVSAKGSEIGKVRGLNLGADDYLSKPFGVLELIARIRANLRKRGAGSGQVSRYKDIAVDDERHTVTVGDKPIATTTKEYDLIRTLVKNSGKALDRNFLLDRVWGENYGETRTLDLHIMQVRRLLDGSAAQIRTIRGVGYMLE